MAERAEYTFTVKEGAEGKPWIAAEPMGDTMPSFRGMIGFDLAHGQQGEPIACMMVRIAV
jgi:hypothetical protein